MTKSAIIDNLQFDPTLASREDFDSFIIIDIRDNDTVAESPIRLPNVEHIPADAFIFGKPPQIKKENAYLVCCYHGNDSKLIARMLRMFGVKTTFSVKGGFELLDRLIASNNWA